MVDAVLSFVVERLGDYLIQEAIFLQEVRSEVELLKNELEWMQCFIKDAEVKQDDDSMIRKWLSDIRDIAYDTEDVLDKFLLKVGYGEATGRKPGLFSSIKNCSCINSAKGEVHLYSIGKEIEKLRKRISDLSQKRETYRLENIDKNNEAQSSALGRLKELRRATSFAGEETVIGFDGDANILLAKLLETEPRRCVISIFGMGGLGKTTLARKLYHQDDVTSKFDCRAWVCVSQDYTTEDLLLRIIKSFNTMETAERLEKMCKEDMQRYLRGFLEEYSYLVVIDDVWGKEVWESLKKAFPDNNCGSRIIITTRIREVAERSDARTHVHELQFLRPVESWQLFCEKAFRKSTVDEGLEKLGREMVEKCGGLPLAIIVLGGLLSAKKPHEWRALRDHIWRHLRNDSIHISYLLDLSFNELPYQLKLCFLYLGIFPEDFEINVEQVIRLLVAEGFIGQDTDQLMEEVAQDNLDELINRSLIKIEKTNWGKAATCRVHDLLRDLSIQKAKQLNFIHIYDEVRNSSSSSIISCRRQAVYSATKRCAWLHNCNPLSRSLLLFNQKWDVSFKFTEHFAPLCKRFPLLRVFHIDASDRKIELTKVSGRRLVNSSHILPQEIGKLIHLRYLGIKNAHLLKFPSSIFNLQKLQTLELFGESSVVELPSKISKLQELRHLIGNFTGSLSIENLTNLQTLKYVSPYSWSEINAEKLVNLRELQIESNHDWHKVNEFTFDSIAKLENLLLLSVNLLDYDFFGSILPLSHCSRLVYLRLSGKIKKLPEDMHAVLPSLECLSMKKSHLNEDPMPTLEKLSNLMILSLHCDSYVGKRLKCTAKGFPRLEILQLIDLDELEEWEVEEGAMPMLRGLEIPGNLRIPDRMRSIPPPAERECEESWLFGHDYDQ